jgi:tRNA A-37 threonylcarbamoyl transferase component Bud32
MEDLSGTILKGKFRLDSQLGSGTFGVVYAAHHLMARADLAVKILRSEALKDPLIRNGFLKEARATIGLSSDHIVTVRDIDEDEAGRLFIVMDRVNGGTLGEWVDKHAGPDRRVPVKLTVRIISQIGLALRDAHAKGVVHRDLKPDNVLITVDEDDGGPRVMVVDFSTAWRTKPASNDTTELLHQVVGTPAYMSPEQCMGKPLDERADLYALGVILFELLTGVRPIEADPNQGYLVAHVAHQPRALEDAAPTLAVPSGIARLVMALLAKAPADRPESAEAVLEALAAPDDPTVLGAEPTPEPEPVADGKVASNSVMPTAMRLAMAAVIAVLMWARPWQSKVVPEPESPVVTPAAALPGSQLAEPPRLAPVPLKAEPSIDGVEPKPTPIPRVGRIEEPETGADRRASATQPVGAAPEPVPTTKSQPKVAAKPRPKPATATPAAAKPKPKPVAAEVPPTRDPIKARPRPTAPEPTVTPTRPTPTGGNTKERASGAFDERDGL